MLLINLPLLDNPHRIYLCASDAYQPNIETSDEIRNTLDVDKCNSFVSATE